jgi:putative oxidoreductase
MRLTGTIARILTGIIFVVLGLNAFLLFIPQPPPSSMPVLAVQFNAALFASHYVWMTSGLQVICGALLLVNRYVPLALVILAGELVNILTFHITMWPAGLPLAVVAAILWFLTAWPFRAYFAPLFASRVPAT